MICRLEKKGIEELKTTNILPQTTFWGRIKRNQGFIPKGFGGNLYHRMGCWDYPYNQKLYALYRLQEIKN